MIKRILTIVAATLLVGLFVVPTSCVKEDFDNVPSLNEIATWESNTTIAELKALFKNNNPDSVANLIRKFANTDFWNSILNGGTDSSIIISGYVISCDSASNFYETVTIMDESGGIDLKVNADELYLTYGLKPGQKVFVKVNDMALDNYHGTYQIGLPTTDAHVLEVTGIEFNNLPKYVQRSGKRIDPEVVNLNIEEITKEHVQRLVRIDSVQFRGLDKTFSESGINTNRILIDSKGNAILLRTSGFAKFSQDSLTKGSGSIVGVLGIYNETFQLVIRDLNDIQFNNPAFPDNIPTPNKTIAQLKAMCTSDLVKINQDFVIEAVVNANDESGNIYKTLFIEDETGAIEFKVDVVDLYSEYPAGTKIIVNCNGLYVGKYKGVIQLGGVYNSEIGRLSATDFSKSVYIMDLGVKVTPVETTIGSLNDNLIGKVITLSNVQFSESELGKTFAEVNSTTNRYIEDENGNTVIVRTSQYADFAGELLPSGNGKLTAVLSKYLSDYQLYIRYYDEVEMTGNRFVKNYIMNQSFNGVTSNQPVTVDGWKSIAIAGSKQWIGKDYSGNKYAEMNPYNSGEASNIGWLISPKVTIPSGSNTFLSFATQFSYWANSQLEVFVSTDYNGTDPNSATWTEITDAYIIQESDGYNKWVKSGNVNISNYSGDIYIGFKYTGGGTIGQTTAFRVDDVAVFTQE